MKYYKGTVFKSDREYLNAIISHGSCYLLDRRNPECKTECFICKKHQELYDKGIMNMKLLVIFCKELLKKEDIQQEFDFEMPNP